MSWFTDEFHALIAWLAGIGSKVFALIAPLAKTIAENGGAVLAQIALDAVMAAEANGGDGAAKFAAAQTTIISELKSKGLPVVMNAVNGALEAAVSQMDANKTVDTASVVDTAAPEAAPVS
jgi:hypothetical protein